jgi:hypothetical protein
VIRDILLDILPFKIRNYKIEQFDLITLIPDEVFSLLFSSFFEEGTTDLRIFIYRFSHFYIFQNFTDYFFYKQCFFSKIQFAFKKKNVI